MAVDAKRHRRVGVSEATGHGSNIDAGADQLGGGEVPEVVQTDVRGADRLPDAGEQAGHVVRPERRGPPDVGREHEGIRCQLDRALPAPLLHPLAVRAQQAHPDRVERDLSDATGLRRLLDEATWHADDRADDLDHAGVEVHLVRAKGLFGF